MAKFKVNENVIVNATGQKGIIMCKEEIRDKVRQRTNVTYLVKLGNGFENYKTFKRDELSKYPRFEDDDNRIKVKIYDAPDGYKVTLWSKVHYEDNVDELVFIDSAGGETEVKFKKDRIFRMGVSIYNPVDEYNEQIGIKLAKHRAFKSPFCCLKARFSGEFNNETVEALMDVKAKYIVKNLKKFIK